jgi:hypothetical protein
MSLPSSTKAVVEATIASPLKWTINLVRTPGQSEESFAEQTIAVEMLKKHLNQFQYNVMSQTKGLIIVGGPGTGKTACLQAGALEAMCRGLNTNLTALMSERSRQLGGIHICNFFLIPVNEKATPGRLAELAIARLLRNPKQLALIKVLDVVLLDEFGQVAAELVCVIDIILRRVRESTDFMGGVLLLASLDGCQLRPVSGRPPLLSPHMLTSFEFVPLDHSVRATFDPGLMRIVDITRLPRKQFSPDVRQEFKSKIIHNCTHVSSFDHPLVQRDVLRVFATNDARIDTERQLLAKIKKKYRGLIRSRKALDYESSTESNWVEATSATTRMLNKHNNVKEPETLYFYPHAIYEITFNRDGQFSQSQLAVLAEVPTADAIRDFQPVSVYVAPEGMKAVSSELKTETDYLDNGFRKRLVGAAPERAKDIGYGILGKRRQYGLRHHFAATIHAAMGQTLPAIVTKVTGPKMYHLFEREQVVVLLSRTRFAKDIIFVGDATETAEALAKMLDATGPYAEYMDYLVAKLVHHSVAKGPSIDLTYHHPFCPCDVEIPNGNTGFAYLLVSLARGAENCITYTGECKNLVVRLRKHKMGAGPTATADPGLKPWALLAYVGGFGDASKNERLYFERLWEAARDRANKRRRRQHLAPLTAEDIADLGRDLVTKRVYVACPGLSNVQLTFVRCGRYVAD